MKAAVAAVVLCAANSLVSWAAAGAAAAAQPYTRPTVDSECLAVNETDPAATGNVLLFPTSYQVSDGSSAQQQPYVNITIAQDFTVQYMNNYKVVNNSLADEVYVLYQCGTQMPNISAFPAGTKMFQIPLTSVALTENVPYAYLDVLGVTDRMHTVSPYTVSPCGQLRAACGQTTKLNFTQLSDANAISSAVDPVADAVIVSSASAADRSITFSATKDPGPLNRAEWIKFLGLFFNKDQVAQNFFNAVNQSYYEAAGNYSGGGRQPTVAWINRYAYDPDYAFEVSFAPYKRNFTQDAGARMPDQANLAAGANVVRANYDYANILWFAWGKNDKSFASESEASVAFQTFLKTIDVVIDETYAIDPTNYTLSTFLRNFNLTGPTANQTYPFLKNQAVFREDGLLSNGTSGYGLDWFEGALIRPDKVLTDMVRAVQPKSLPKNYTWTWLRNIAAGEAPVVQTPVQCSSAQTLAPGLAAPIGAKTVSVGTGTNQSTLVCPAQAPLTATQIIPICALANPCNGTDTNKAAPLMNVTNTAGNVSCIYAQNICAATA